MEMEWIAFALLFIIVLASGRKQTLRERNAERKAEMAEERAATLEDRVRDVQQALHERDTAQSSLNSKLVAALRRGDEVLARAQTAEQRAERTQAELEKLQSEFTAADQCYQRLQLGAAVEHERQMAELRIELEAAQNECNAKTAECQVLLQDADVLRTSATDAANQLKFTQAELKFVQGERVRLHESVDNLATQLAQVNRSLALANASLAVHVADALKWRQRRAAAREEQERAGVALLEYQRLMDRVWDAGALDDDLSKDDVPF